MVVDERWDKLIEMGMKPLWAKLWLRLAPVTALDPPWGLPGVSAQALVSRFLRGNWSLARLEPTSWRRAAPASKYPASLYGAVMVASAA